MNRRAIGTWLEIPTHKLDRRGHRITALGKVTTAVRLCLYHSTYCVASGRLLGLSGPQHQLLQDEDNANM